MLRLLILSVLLLISFGAKAQFDNPGVTQNGSIAAGNCASWQANGIIQDSGVACAGGAVTATLGTSVTAANPQISGDATSGLYTPGAAQVAITLSGAQELAMSTTALNIASGNSYQIGAVNAVRIPTNNTTANGSLAVGAAALATQDALSSAEYFNVAVGADAIGLGTLTTAAVRNTAVGYQAGGKTTSGTQNTYMGYKAGLNSTTGGTNTAVGHAALSAANGGGNTAIGANAGNAMTGSAAVFVGTNAGLLVTGAGNTVVGPNVGSTVLTTGTNNILIGVSNAVTTAASSTANTIQIGGTSSTGGQGWVTVTGTNTANTQIATFKGVIRVPDIGADTALTTTTVCQDTTNHQLYSGSGVAGICVGTSSKRYKHSISDVKEGLAEVIRLKPVNFFYNAKEADHGAREQYGLIAEDVVEVIPKLVGLDKEGNPNSVDYMGFVAILIKAVQEQQEQIQNLKAVANGHKCFFNLLLCAD